MNDSIQRLCPSAACRTTTTPAVTAPPGQQVVVTGPPIQVVTTAPAPVVVVTGPPVTTAPAPRAPAPGPATSTTPGAPGPGVQPATPVSGKTKVDMTIAGVSAAEFPSKQAGVVAAIAQAAGVPPQAVTIMFGKTCRWLIG